MHLAIRARTIPNQAASAPLAALQASPILNYCCSTVVSDIALAPVFTRLKTNLPPQKIASPNKFATLR
ncbi:hypothetical protein GCM10022212_10130 [Actimicrobium antarcticum]|uniref:Uncharacterized protein n=1 Tax=Actimicrobium antarcticum TaxID=1051899 RepID=A0ABP7SV12_9BURK